MPGQAEHVHARRRAPARAPRAARRARREADRVERRPRARRGRRPATPLTCRSRPSRVDVVVGAGPAASVRKPTRPASTTCSPSRARPPGARRAAAGSPCVCGHQRADAGDPHRPGRERAVGLGVELERRPERCPRDRSPRPRPRSVAAAERPQAALDREHAVVAVEARAQRSASTTTAAAPLEHTGRHGPTAAGPGAKPGARPRSDRAEEAQVRRRRRAACASAPAGGARSASSGAERAAADRKLVAVPQPRRRRRPRGRRTSTRSSAIGSPFRKTSATVAMPVEPQHELLARRRAARRRRPSGTTSPRRRGRGRRGRRRRRRARRLPCPAPARRSSRARRAPRVPRPRRRPPAIRSRARSARVRGPARASRRARAMAQPTAASSAVIASSHASASRCDVGLRVERPPARELEARAPCSRRRSACSAADAAAPVVAEQPVDVRGERARRPTRPCGRSRRRRRGRRRRRPRAGRAGRAPAGAPKRVERVGLAGARARWRAQQLARRRAQLVAAQPRAGVEAHQLGVGRQDVGRELAPEAEDAAVVLAVELVQAARCGSSAAARPSRSIASAITDVLTCSVR